MFGSLPAPAVLQALLEGLEGVGIGCTVVLDHGDRMERVYANQALATIFGLDLEAMRKLPPMEILSPKERERLDTVRAALRESGAGPVFVETEIVRADGAVVPIELGLAHGVINGVSTKFAFLRDASAKHATEVALRESEERFRRVAESSPDSITIYSAGKYIYANPVALKILGLSSVEELANVNPLASVPVERHDEVRAHGDRTRKGDKGSPLQFRRTGPDGEDRLIEASLSSTSIDGVPALISYARDITERVRLHAELMKRDRLASLGTLASGVAHELNNPLTSLSMQARRLHDDADRHGFSAEVREALGQMHEATTRMTAIIADLLFIARPVEQPQAHVDVAQILGSTLALLRAGTVSWPTVHVQLEPIPCVEGYASKLGQVFLNILRNAVQAVENRADGEINVRASVEGERVVVGITDNGAGVPKHVIPHLMQPFFTTKPQGTGIGLWISQTLVALHGGSLEIESEEGRGTTVTVRLPQRLEGRG